METLVLTKQQALAVETVKNDESYPVESLVNYHLHSVWTSEPYKSLNELTLETLLEAYYKGYKVEQTKEDKLKEFFKECDRDTACFRSNYAVRKTLDILNIKIEGINV